MAKSNNQLPSLKQLASTKTKIPGASSLANLESSSPIGSSRPGRSRDTTSSSFSGKITTSGLRFGNPSSSGTSTSTSSSEWSNLLKKTASGGISSALGGGLKDIGGIASIVSGFIGLFSGGKSAPPPLVRYQSPTQQNQTAFIGSTTGPANWADSGTSSHNTASTAIYASNPESNTQSLQYSSTQIAQAVKQALLQSSSLNDVIAEI